MYANNKGRGRGRYPTKLYENWKTAAAWELKAQQPPTVTYRCELVIDLDDTQRGDCDNRVKPILDLLVSQGVLQGDQKKYVQRVSVGWEPTSGCRVTIRGA
jgi:Holliday junction resolvase RusA-like endonuclease